MTQAQALSSTDRVKSITCYIDFISPFAWLSFQQLPKALMGLSYSVAYKPVLFGAILKHHGQLGPAEIQPKRDWTYRHVLWLADSLDVELQMPSAHPFNPLPLLRLALACGVPDEPGIINRYICETIFRHVWQGGADAADPQRLQQLTAQLEPQRRFDADEVKQLLSSNTAQAIAAGVFGVPAFMVDDKLFWGLDALPMLRDYLSGGAWFQGDSWQQASRIGVGVSRQKS